MLMDQLRARGVGENNIVRFSFDALEWEDKSVKDVFTAVRDRLAPSGRTYLFLDEVQEIEGWERMVNTFMQETEYDVDIVVTGSNSKMMSSEISTYLTGRYISFRIHPLSFVEYLDFRKAYSSVGEMRAEFMRYIEYGGFPAVHLRELSRDEAYVIIRDIYTTTVYTDIVKRGSIRKVDQLENAFILNRCSRCDLHGREILKTHEKFYLADTAFKHAVMGYGHGDISQTMENIIYLELCRRGYNVHVGKLDAHEIDFVAQKQGSTIYVQVAYLLADEKTREREFGNLLKIQDNFPKFVISMDEVDMSYKGIAHMNIRDFLLLGR
jgi:hypothetical protein